MESRELVLVVDKVNETLDSILKAHEKYIKADIIILPNLKEYPSPL